MNPTATTPPTRPFFLNGPLDFALVGGLSIVTYLVLQFAVGGDRTSAITTAALVLTCLCNWPHFAASSYRLYHSSDNIRQYPVTALVIPWVVLAGVVGCFLSPALVAPYFVKLFRIWSPYHFSGQSLGISLIYARRCGFKVTPWERLALSGFIFGTFLAGTVRAETSTTATEFWGIPDQGLGLPQWTTLVADAWMWLAGAAFLVLALRWCLRERRPLPLMVVLPAVTQYVWFVQGSVVPAFQELVPFFHSLQYLLIAWSVQLKGKMDQQHITPSPRYVIGETLRWAGLIVAGGVGLFFVVPQVLARVGFDLNFATGVVICGVQIHHFFVDGVIWKLKNKNVSSPLMVNLDDLVGSPQRVPAAAAAA